MSAPMGAGAWWKMPTSAYTEPFQMDAHMLALLQDIVALIQAKMNAQNS